MFTKWNALFYDLSVFLNIFCRIESLLVIEPDIVNEKSKVQNNGYLVYISNIRYPEYQISGNSTDICFIHDQTLSKPMGEK